jgi:hypothetical protein
MVTAPSSSLLLKQTTQQHLASALVMACNWHLHIQPTTTLPWLVWQHVTCVGLVATLAAACCWACATMPAKAATAGRTALLLTGHLMALTSASHHQQHL